jgi:hypothetical protein
MRTLTLARALALACFATTGAGLAQPDLVFASGFDTRGPCPTVLVEFTILQPLLVETVTCSTWAAPWDSTQWGRFMGSGCTSTGAIPDRTGTQGGNVDAEFAMAGGGTLTLTGCVLAGLSASGGGGGAIVTYNVDCD